MSLAGFVYGFIIILKRTKKNKSPKINFRRLMSEFYTNLIIQQYPKKSIGGLDGKKNG